MVATDPFLIISGGVIVAVVIVVFSCLRSNAIGASNVVIPDKVLSAKPKKKKSSTVSKHKSNSKSSHKRVEVVENSVISDIEVEPVKQVVKFDVTVPEELVSSSVQEDVNPIAVEEEPTKKSKKAKETPEQKASRLERQKVAKTNSKKSDDAAVEWNDVNLSPAELAVLQQMQVLLIISTFLRCIRNMEFLITIFY